MLCWYVQARCLATVRYNTHHAAQALANISNNNYTSQWVQISRQGIGFASAIETHLPRKQRFEAASQA